MVKERAVASWSSLRSPRILQGPALWAVGHPRMVLGQEQSLKSDCLGWVLALPLAGILSLSKDPTGLGPSVSSGKEAAVTAPASDAVLRL